MANSQIPESLGLESYNRPVAALSLGHVGYVLAVLWFAVTAVQYAGAVQRTNALIANDSSIGPLAALDLTPIYAVLLAVTAAFGIVRYLSQRHALPPAGPSE